METHPFAILAMVAVALLAGAGCSKKEEPAKAAVPAPAKSAASTNLGESDYAVAGVRIALLELRRSGPDGVLLRWQYRNESDQALKMELGAMGMDSYRFAKDVMLKDSAGNKYGVRAYSTPEPEAARHDEFKFSVTLPPKQIVNTWAKLDAPAHEVKHVTVVIPGAPPFDNIPIQD